MMMSLKPHCHRARFLIYNLGVSKSVRDVLETASFVELIDPPAAMPDFARKFDRHNKGFKPIVIADAISRGCGY